MCWSCSFPQSVWPHTMYLENTWESRAFLWFWNHSRNKALEPAVAAHGPQPSPIMKRCHVLDESSSVRSSHYPMTSTSIGFLSSPRQRGQSSLILLSFSICPPLSPHEGMEELAHISVPNIVEHMALLDPCPYTPDTTPEKLMIPPIQRLPPLDTQKRHPLSLAYFCPVPAHSPSCMCPQQEMQFCTSTNFSDEVSTSPIRWGDFLVFVFCFFNAMR